MRITDFKLRNSDGVLRAEASVIWEDVERAPFQLFVETDEQHADEFKLDPNSFLTICVVPAWQMRETRIHIDGALCPVLCENIRAAMTILGTWYYKLGWPPHASRPIKIEAGEGFSVQKPVSQKSMSLLSCGIDSLATFRWHRMNLPTDHPANIQGVLAVAFGDQPSAAENPRLAPAIEVEKESGIEAFGVRTNLRNLIDDG